MAAHMMIAELRALEERVSKNFDYLREMEERGDTGPRYDRLCELWEKLLRQYEEEEEKVG